MLNLKQRIANIRYSIRKLRFLRILSSPLKPLRLWFYWGKIKHGTPYFLPRKTVPSKEKKGYMTFKPVKWLWFDMISLGWKPKWDELRYEWSPAISIVLLKTQIFILFTPRLDKDCYVGHYWEAWLYYDQRTDKSKSKKERLIELFNQHSCTWIRYEGGTKVSIDYYPMILKDKYLKIYRQWQTSQESS